MCEGWHWGAGSFLMARDSSLVPASFLLYNSKVTKGECVMSLIRKLGWFLYHWDSGLILGQRLQPDSAAYYWAGY
mgnify:CR=1 FL=1